MGCAHQQQPDLNHQQCRQHTLTEGVYVWGPTVQCWAVREAAFSHAPTITSSQFVLCTKEASDCHDGLKLCSITRNCPIYCSIDKIPSLQVPRSAGRSEVVASVVTSEYAPPNSATVHATSVHGVPRGWGWQQIYELTTAADITVKTRVSQLCRHQHARWP